MKKIGKLYEPNTCHKKKLTWWWIKGILSPHYHQINMPTVLLHGELQNSTQISQLDLKKDQPQCSEKFTYFSWCSPSDILVKSIQPDIVKRKSSPYDGSSQASNSVNQCLTSRTPRSHFNTTYGSTQVTRKFQNRVTLVWGRPTVACGWTNLGHQGSMSVFTRNKCYRILDLLRITFSPCVSSVKF